MESDCADLLASFMLPPAPQTNTFPLNAPYLAPFLLRLSEQMNDQLVLTVGVAPCNCIRLNECEGGALLKWH